MRPFLAATGVWLASSLFASCTLPDAPGSRARASLPDAVSADAARPDAGTGNPPPTVFATTREIRGRVTTRRPPGRNISHVVVVDAKTRRIVATAMPNATGNFVLTNVMKGRVYRIVAIIGRTPRPITFSRAAGRIGNTNLFKMSVHRCGRAQCDDAPVDLGELTDDGTDISPQDDAHSPMMYQDSDGDGMLDGADTDLDGDRIPNATDNDDDNNGLPDTGDPTAAQGMHTSGELGDSDGDGLTDDGDPDADNDMVPNSLDTDDDGDGTPDATETDTDDDGIPNATDGDVDGDGVLNADDTDANGDGVIDVSYQNDLDGDGVPNAMDDDADGDGVPNAMDTDSDNDGINNEHDPDANNDGMMDMPMTG